MRTNAAITGNQAFSSLDTRDTNGLQLTQNSQMSRASLIDGLGGSAGFGEDFIVRNDDRSTVEIDITEIFEGGINFFGREFTTFWINNNGGVTFNGPRGSFTPSVITDNNSNPEITPFFADVDTRGGTTAASAGGTSSGSNLVHYDFDTANDRIIVTWDDVGYYSNQTDLTNAFQLILEDRGNGDFDIEFRYESIEWTTGSASGGTGGLGGVPARAGFTASTGDPNAYFELPASGDQAALLQLAQTVGNTGQVGIWQFSVRSGDITSGDIPELPTLTLTGATTGDPHLVTLDGVGYDFHAAGEFVLLRSTNNTDFEIQSRMTPVEGSDSLTVNEAIAMRVGGSNVMLDANDDDPFSIDGVAITIDNFSSMMVGSDEVFRANNVYTIVLAGSDGVINDGDSQVEITILNGRIDLVLSLNDDLAGNLEGLLGDGDGDATNDVAFANGAPLIRPFAFEDVYGLYRDDWRVDTVADSLFTYDAGETLDGFYLPDHPNEIASLDGFSEAEIAAATTTLLAAGLVEGTINFNNALLDFLVTGDESFIGSATDAPVILVDEDTQIFTAADLGGRPTTADDFLEGTSGADTINALQGDDTVRGLQGRDEIRGGSGDDDIRGGAGRDRLFGQRDDDEIRGEKGNDVVNGQAGEDSLYGGQGDDVVKGGGDADVLYGNAGNDFLKGGTFNDVAVGGSGDDSISGNRGRDDLDGGLGNDTLKGGSGKDTLEGGGGDDFLKGGSGADQFVFGEGDGNDEIDDFDIARDTLVLSSDLLGQVNSGAAVLNTFASVTSAGVVLDFGGGDSITLSNLNSLGGLANDIDII